jgi:phage-related protein
MKDVVWLNCEVKSPPFSDEARHVAGFLLRRLQQGHSLQRPESDHMENIGPRCHELRIDDQGVRWRIFYRIDPDVILIAEVFCKTGGEKDTNKAIEVARKRLAHYDQTRRKGR